MANAPNEVQLFKVNLISDQISILLRRKAFQQLAGVAVVLMIAAGTALAILLGIHLSTAIRMRIGTQSKMKELEGLQKMCADLDNQKERATQRAGAVAPLLPIARQRVAWAPKLAAVAAALTPGTGVTKIEATQRDVLVVRASTDAKSASSASVAQDNAGLPQMAIAILCSPSAGGVENLGAFVDRLDKDATFKNKFDSVRLTAIEQDRWAGSPVEILRIRAQGIPK